jgi:hypothetical protein
MSLGLLLDRDKLNGKWNPLEGITSILSIGRGKVFRFNKVDGTIGGVGMRGLSCLV